MQALVFDGKVVDISQETFEVHSSFQWVKADENVKVGFYFDGKNFVNPFEKSENQKKEDDLKVLRSERNKRLASTDWWVLPDNNPSPEQLEYRQALRDITNHYSSPLEVVWPEKPQ
ncbi:hypothetical protein CRP804_gp38 [Roseobacter phage CRP-804]|uniref:Phage tail assembly chaperone-like domain-containing protein n=1 Tax=Roseobacter phage CRP-804 TaxID=3072850 RepID=A0AAX3ZWH5_9CAUD|nr:hypothetical protein CRP804_gp38 [Roseobacter phage CRP-804]